MADEGPFGDARRAFGEWRRRYPGNVYSSDLHLQLLNGRYLEATRLADLTRTAESFGAAVAGPIAAAVERYRNHPPQLAKYDGHGTRTEAIEFHDAYHEAGRLVWESGVLRHAAEPGRSFEQANLFYLASSEGEMGHMCAATCTTGLVRVLRRHASDPIKKRYLGRLTSDSYDDAMRGAQFLTEVQGGSDVGANASQARRIAPGRFTVSGEKWFCSVADADLFLVLARPEGAPPGTGGLGCFAVPRVVDGQPNGFSIRRLKDKLGTTAMASAEIDFDGAVADLIGAPDAGFKIMVTAMLNTSRWLNAIGNVGIMRRAYIEASNYAAVRRAFGSSIGGFPVVRRQLAEIKVEWLAALYSTWELTDLDEAVDHAAMGGAPTGPGAGGFHRYLVNANKLVCSLAATDVVRRAIEVLGGNGAIEEFSVLPRLLRDAVVYEQWEGTHNVLAAQVLRDLGRLGLGGTVVDRTASTLKGIADQDLGLVADRAQTALEDLAGHVARCVEEPGFGALHFRSLLERLLRVHQVALLLQAAEEAADNPLGPELGAAGELLLGRYLEVDYRAEDDPRFADLVERVLGSDLD